jgi:elongation factor Ts
MMATISAKEVNELRKMTGAGMMDCKKALVEANGDIEAAVDILRKKGQKVAAKRSDRDANEGLVIAKTNDSGTEGAIVMVNCETDFVAKNQDFMNLADRIAQIALDNKPGDGEALKALPYDSNGMSIAEKIIEQTGVIGEKLDISGYGSIKSEYVFAYNHPGNKVASLVGLNKAGFDEAAKDVAMQAAAMAPVALTKDNVPQEIIDKELEIGKELAIQEGKPAEMAEKIAMGRLNKFFKESTLLSQQFIKDSKLNVEQYLQSQDKELTVTDFKRFALGS